jgi:uncharacterized protein (TIGR03435 family)
MEPGVFGIIRPVLLWPERIAPHMDDVHLESVLAHEVCHVQRWDNLTSAIHMLVEAIFWFHPVVWWVERQLVKERERACDEAVLQLGNEAAVYAESILNVCKFYTESPIACVSGVTGSELKQRIARILSGQGVRKLDLWRKAMLALACVLAVGVPLAAGSLRAAHGQTQPAQQNGIEKSGIAGTWQGTEHTPDGHDLRMVLKIAKDEKGALSATLYSLEQTELPPARGSVRFQEGKLRFVNDFPGLTYEGTMSADRNSMSGTMTYAKRSLPLAMERAKPETEWAIPAAPAKIAPMVSGAKPDVEVATVKPTPPGNQTVMFGMQGGTLVIKDLTLGFLMSFAYNLPARQIAGKPGWMDTDKWDIDAKPDTPGMPNESQVRVIVQELLAERFGLQFHEEKRRMAAYALIVSKEGPKLTKTADASSSPNLLLYPQGVIIAKSATIADLAQLLQDHILGQPMVDKTGLEGRWDFTMRWTPDETQFADVPEPVRRPADDANAPPPLFTAIATRTEAGSAEGGRAGAGDRSRGSSVAELKGATVFSRPRDSVRACMAPFEPYVRMRLLTIRLLTVSLIPLHPHLYLQMLWTPQVCGNTFLIKSPPLADPPTPHLPGTRRRADKNEKAPFNHRIDTRLHRL